MRINGKITEIITSRALVSFGGFVELEGKEFEDMKNIFTYLCIISIHMVIQLKQT